MDGCARLRSALVLLYDCSLLICLVIYLEHTAPTRNPSSAPSTSDPTIGSSPTSSPTFSNSPTAIAMAPSSAPIAFPQNGIYAVVFETIFVNLFLRAPTALAEEGLAGDTGGGLDELRRITSSHILDHVRSVVNEPDLVVDATTEITTVSTLSPWRNNTVVSSHSVAGSVRFDVRYGRPRAAGVNAIVQEAFQGEEPLSQYLELLQLSSDEVLRSTDSVYVGLPSDILPTTTTTTTTTATTAEGDAGQSSEAADNEEEWIQWGEWNDTDFIVLIVIGGCAALVTIFYATGRYFGFGGPSRGVRDKPPMVQQSKTSGTAPESPESSDYAEKKSLEHVNNVSNSGVGNSMVAVIGEGGKADDDQHSKEDMEVDPESASRCDISDVTSVYSYIDTRSMLNDLDDTAYSVTDAYNAQLPGDEESGQWSVKDVESGAVGEPVRTSSLHVGTGPSSVAESRESEVTPNNKAPAGTIVPSPERDDDGPMIFADTSGDTGEVASSTADLAKEGQAGPARTRVASFVATFEAAASKSAKNSPTKTDEASFPDNIESSILRLAPDSPEAVEVSSNEKQEPVPSPTGSVSGKQLAFSSRENSVDGEERPPSLKSFPKDASSRSRTSSAAVSANSKESSTVPATISVQNSDKTDSTKGSKRSASTDKTPAASYILRSNSADKEEGTNLPTTINVQNSAESSDSNKDAKVPKASYVMRAKAWGSRTYTAKSGTTESNDTAANRPPLNQAAKNRKSFPFRGFGKSKATQMALTAPGNNQYNHAETSSNPSTLSENQSILETDSDIQSLCSLDNHSFFSFGGRNTKNGNSLLGMHGASPYMQGTGLDDDDDED